MEMVLGHLALADGNFVPMRHRNFGPGHRYQERHESTNYSPFHNCYSVITPPIITVRLYNLSRVDRCLKEENGLSVLATLPYVVAYFATRKRYPGSGTHLLTLESVTYWMYLSQKLYGMYSHQHS